MMPSVKCQLEIIDSHRGELFGKVKAYLDDFLVGWVDFSEYDDEIWIKYVFVSPEHRRQGVATAMYEEIRRQFPGERITSSGTTGEGGKLRRSLKEKGIVAKAMDYGHVVNVLHDLMGDVRPGLPTPNLKIVNHARSNWLGRCSWTYGEPTTVIELQKAICVEDRTLRRILAHELAHHEEFLTYWVRVDKGSLKMLLRLKGGHGEAWREIAQRWNAKYGKDFITEKSDMNMVQEHDERSFWVLLNRYPGRLMFKASIRLSDKQKKWAMERDLSSYRLVLTTDRDFINAPPIGYGPWRVCNTLEMVHKFEELWKLPDKRQEWWDTAPSPFGAKAGASKAAFVRQDLTWLKQYLTMSRPEMGEELARNWYSYFIDWLNDKYPEELERLGLRVLDEGQEEEALDEFKEDFIDKDLFSRIPPDVYERFLEDGGNWVMRNDPAEAPSFMHLSYEGIVKNQWLLHYTDNADSISREGFTKGMYDLSKLGLTTYYTEKAKETGGYNFAVPADEADSIERFNFGKHAVLFRASGLKTYHSGDEFYQIIFWGKDARDIIPIYHSDNTRNWELPYGSSGRSVFQAEKIQDVVHWAMKNFQQYRSVLVPYPNAGKEPKPDKPLFQTKPVPVAAAVRGSWVKPRSYRAFLRSQGLNPPIDEGEFSYKEDEFDSIILHLNSLRFPLRVYRALEVPVGQEMDLEKLGVCWTWNENSADAYMGSSSIWSPVRDEERGELVLLRADVKDGNDVNWEKTLLANTINPDENEITLKGGARLELTGIMGMKDRDYSPMSRLVTASRQRVRVPRRAEGFLEGLYPAFGKAELGALARRLNSLEFPLTVYRALELPADVVPGDREDFVDTGSVGTSWSLEEGAAHPYGGRGTGRTVLLRAAIRDEGQVDWERTFRWNVREPGESELRLIPGSEVEVTGVREGDGQWAEPPAAWRSMKADSHKQTPHRENVYRDVGEGEGTMGYANQPECVEGTKAALPLEELEEQAKMASGELPAVGRKWNNLKLSHIRIGWLRTQSHRHPDIDFGLPWAGLRDDQKRRISALAAEASQPEFSHKKAVQIRKSSGSQEDALNKIVKILGTGGVGTLVVGGIAVQEYGYPRNTVDIDLSVSDFVKAREILAQNGYRMGNGIVVLDPEYDEEIDILQGGQPAVAGGIPMPMPQEINTSPKVCDLEDLINLKIGSFLGAESAGLAMKRLKDRDDIYILMDNNQLPRDFLKGKTYEMEYVHMWDVLHIPSRKLSHEEAIERLLNIDNDGLIAFHKARMNRQAAERQAKMAGGDLPSVGRKWDSLEHAQLRMGWLRVSADQYSNQEFFFDKPWKDLTAEQREWMAKTAGEVSQLDYNRKKATGVRGGQERALFKVVRILGEGGVGSLVIGGMAVQEHGYPRYTTDIDLSVSDFSKAKKVLLDNGYRSLGGIMVEDPEFKEDIDHIDLLQGGQGTVPGGMAMPVPREVNTSLKFCDLATLLDLKINSYMEADASGKPLDGTQDKADVYELMKRGLARDFMRGRTHESEYKRMWDEFHAAPRKVSRKEASESLRNPDASGLMAFHNARVAAEAHKATVFVTAGFPDPGASTRRAGFRTGKPVTMRAFHVTEADGKIKWGRGGAFFSPEPAGEYGTHYVQVTLNFRNPMVVMDQVDAAQKYASPEMAARIEKLVTEDLPMGDIDPVAGWMNVDRMMAEVAKARGYDSIIYTDPDSLTTMEFVALDPPSVTKVGRPREVMPYLEKKYKIPTKGGPEHLEVEEGAVTASTEVVAYDYLGMFRGFLHDFPYFTEGVNAHINWAKRVLKKRDRIAWWLRWMRLDWYVMVSDESKNVRYIGATNVPGSREGYGKTPNGASIALARKYDALWRQELSRVTGGTGMPHDINDLGENVYFLQRRLEHILSLPVPEIQNLVWDRQKPMDLDISLEKMENKWKKETEGVVQPREEDREIITFGDGWAWWMLDRGYCEEEGKAMGHCGNISGQDDPDQHILSLRQPVKRGDKQYWEPCLTFIWHMADKSLGEMKGKGNEKPVPKYHPYIVALLESDFVRSVKGGGYLPEHNFKMSDLPVDVQDRLMAKKPSLASMAYRVRKEGKTPEIIADLAAKLGMENTYDARLDGYIESSWTPEELVKDYGNDTARWAMEVLTGGEYLDISSYDDLANTKEALGGCGEETLALAARNLAHFHPESVVRWLAEQGNEYSEAARRLLEDPPGLDPYKAAKFLKPIDIGSKGLLGDEDSLDDLILDEGYGVDDAKDTLLKAWQEAARMGTEGEIAKHLQDALEAMMEENNRRNEWVLVQEKPGLWEKAHFVLPFKLACDIADTGQSAQEYYENNHDNQDNWSIDMEQPQYGWQGWDRSTLEETVRDEFSFKEDPGPKKNEAPARKAPLRKTR